MSKQSNMLSVASEDMQLKTYMNVMQFDSLPISFTTAYFHRKGPAGLFDDHNWIYVQIGEAEYLRNISKLYFANGHKYLTYEK